MYPSPFRRPPPSRRPSLGIASAFGSVFLLTSAPAILAQEPTPRGPSTAADSARELRDEALEMFRQLQPRHSQEGLTPDVREGLERARAMWIESASIFERVGDEQARCQLLVNIGSVSALLGDDEAAWEWNRRGLAAARVADRPDTQASALSNLSTLFQRRGETRRAAAHLDSAYAAVAGRGFPEKEGQILVELGDVYAELGEVETAIGHYERALPLLEELGDVGYEARTLFGIAQLHWRLELYDDALEHLEEARQRYVEAGDESGETMVISAQLAVRSARTSDLIGRAMASEDCDLRRRALEAIEHTLREDPEQMQRQLLRMRQMVRDQQGEEEADRTVRQLEAEWKRGLEQLESLKQRASQLLDEVCEGS